MYGAQVNKLAKWIASRSNLGWAENGETLAYGCATKVDHFEAFIQEFLLADNGIGCSNADECRSNNCSQGVCCDAPCTGVCDACDVPGSLGTCRTAPDGYPCADSDPCNGIETCAAGACENGQQLLCNDNNPCTEDHCQQDTGCVYSPATDGAPCSNDNVCDGEDACQNGICTGTSLLQCEDENPCTVDACDPSAGCTHVWFDNCVPPCDACGECEECLNGTCVRKDDCPADGCGCNQIGASSDVLWIGGLMLFLAH